MKKKFIIQWNARGYDDYELIEALDQKQAENCAYEAWKQDAEDTASYSAEPYSEKRAKELDLE